MNDGIAYYTALPARLLEYIKDEASDSLYYQKLADEAPDERAKELLTEFSRDETQHAVNFRYVYRWITGMEANIGIVKSPQIPPYCEAIKARIVAESGDLVKYGTEKIEACDPELANLFYLTSLIEGRHGLRLTTLLCGIGHEKTC